MTARAASRSLARFALVLPIERDSFLNALDSLHELYIKAQSDVFTLDLRLLILLFVLILHLFVVIVHVLRVTSALIVLVPVLVLEAFVASGASVILLTRVGVFLLFISA